MTIMRIFAGALSFSILSGCTGMNIDDYTSTGPAFVLEEYFLGDVRASGIFEDRFGVVRRQFTVEINGTWDGRNLVLDEHFQYSDGEQDRRVWTIKKIDDNSYVGRADDVIGLAQEGKLPPIPIETRPLSAANATLEDMKEGAYLGRVVLKP